jgi:hypothetical protein
MKKLDEYSGKTIKYGNIKTEKKIVEAFPKACFTCDFSFRSGNYFFEINLTDPIPVKVALCGKCFKNWKAGKFLI